MISAVILSGGASTRMGRDKALLTLEGTTFLRRIIRLYTESPVGGIVVVLGPDADRARNEIAGEDVVVVVNPNTAGGQISSLNVGIETFGDSDTGGVIVHPVDHPMVSGATVRALLDAATANPDSIILPVCEGRRGHPVYFPGTIFRDLKNTPAGTGARAVIGAHDSEIVEIETTDRGIHINIDTEEEYDRVQRDMRGSP